MRIEAPARYFLGAVLGLVFIFPGFAIAANVTPNTPLAPVVPQTASHCPLGYGAFFQVIQNVTNDSIILAVIFAVILIAIAGFYFVFSPTNPGNVSKGRTILIDTIIGFVFVLAAWLLVNELLSVFTTGGLSSVTSLLQPTSTNLCLGGSP